MGGGRVGGCILAAGALVGSWGVVWTRSEGALSCRQWQWGETRCLNAVSNAYFKRILTLVEHPRANDRLVCSCLKVQNAKAPALPCAAGDSLEWQVPMNLAEVCWPLTL